MKRLVIFLFCLLLLNTASAACTPTGSEILNNGIDEDCDGYMNTNYYDIKTEHPRILLNNGNLERLRGYACYDNYGNVISGCTPSERWTRFKNAISPSNPDDYGREAWHYALLYKITQSSTYRDVAINKLNSDLDSFFADTRFDSHLHSGDVMKNIGLTFDWMYDDLSESTKTRILGYMNQAAYETIHGVWNSNECPCDAGSSSCPNTGVTYDCAWSGWGLHQSLNNYHYGHLLTYSYAFVTLIGEESGNDFLNYMDEFQTHMEGDNGGLQNQNLYCEGGGWMEGINYNYASKMRILEIYKLLKTSTKTDYFSELNFMQTLPYYQFFVIQPGISHIVPFGDLARSSEMPIYDYDWVVIGAAANFLPDSEAKRMAQYWRSHTLMRYGDLTESGFNTPDDFLLYVENAPETNYQSMLSYYAPGSGFINARSGWDEDDVSLTFKSTCYFESHQNPDQNTFLIWRDGWQIVDDNTYSSTGIIQNTLGENTMYINGQGQNSRISSMKLNQPVANQNECGHITGFEEAGSFVYMEGDAKGVYPTLNEFTRQFVYLRPDMIVMHDKVESTSSSYSKQSLFHFGSSPTISGNQISHTEGSGKVFIQKLLPATATITTASDSDIGASSSRAMINAPTGSTFTTFLNVLEVPSSSKSSMIQTSLIESSNMEGSSVNNQYIVMFSKTMNDISSTSFSVSGSGSRTLILTDLIPNNHYTISVSNNVITLSSGGSSVASSEGILYAQISLSGGVTPSCNIGEQITSSCLCGSGTYSSGYCCTGGIHQTTPCQSEPYCGDGTCNGDETSSSCPEDCICTESWTCTDWTTCTDNQQTRICTDQNDCGTTNDKPDETQSCQSQFNTDLNNDGKTDSQDFEILNSGYGTTYSLMELTLLGKDYDEDTSSQEEVLAFPGAQGFGAKATGGRGGRVIKVTNLNANGAGSLQEALNQNEPRIIVFDVSGVITGDIEIPYGDVTIAGQTAPGAGITIEGRLTGEYDFGVTNIIIRHIRIRPEEYTGSSGNQHDSIQLSRNSDIILDHVSASFGVDEILDLYNANRVTIQYSTIAEAATEGHPDGEHNYGLINGPNGKYISIHHNLFAHNKNRNPAIANGPADIINNVAYNVRHGFVHHNPATGKFNIIGNYYRDGPTANIIPFFFDAEADDGTIGYHLLNNYIDDPSDYVGYVDNPFTEDVHSSFESLCSYHVNSNCGEYYSSQEYDFSTYSYYIPINTENAQTAYTNILNNAGAFPRDIVDEQIVSETIDRIGSWGARIPSNLLEGLSPTTPPTDSDNDGIADSWEISHGLNENDNSDYNTLMNSGYTAIEEYINELADNLIN